MVPTPPVIKTPIILPIISRISLTNFGLSFYFHFNKKDFGLYNRSLCLNELCSLIYTILNDDYSLFKRYTPFAANYRSQFYFRTTDVTGIVKGLGGA